MVFLHRNSFQCVSELHVWPVQIHHLLPPGGLVSDVTWDHTTITPPPLPVHHFCCVGGPLDGPSLAGLFEVLHFVAPASGLAHKTSASHFDGLASGPSTVAPALLHELGVLKLSSCRSPPPKEQLAPRQLPAWRLRREERCPASTVSLQPLQGTWAASPDQLPAPNRAVLPTGQRRCYRSLPLTSTRLLW